MLNCQTAIVDGEITMFDDFHDEIQKCLIVHPISQAPPVRSGKCPHLPMPCARIEMIGLKVGPEEMFVQPDPGIPKV